MKNSLNRIVLDSLMSLFSISGKIALVTGSSRGLGFRIAKGFAEAGANIILNGRDNKALQIAQHQLESEGLTVSAFAFDVTDKEQVDEQISAIENQIGHIDILVNNAGIHRRG